MKTWEKILLYPIGLYLWLTDGIKKMSKKWKPAMAMLMAVVMLCGMLPVTVFAAIDVITVAGTNVVDGTNVTYWLCDAENGTITGEGADESNYQVKYDPATTTITLNGATIGGNGIRRDDSYDDYNVVLAEGTTNRVTSVTGSALACAYGSIVISGAGSLNATGAANGIWADCSVTITDGANVTATGLNGCGIFSDSSFDTIYIKNGATAILSGSTYGIGGYADVEIDNASATVTGDTAAFKSSYAIGGIYKWRTSESGAFTISAETKFRPNSTITRVEFIPVPTYAVIFDANGGTGTMITADVKEGEEYTLPKCGFTAPAGKQFKAWSVGSSEKKPGNKITVSANTTVSAVWQDLVEGPTITITGLTAPQAGQSAEEWIDGNSPVFSPDVFGPNWVNSPWYEGAFDNYEEMMSYTEGDEFWWNFAPGQSYTLDLAVLSETPTLPLNATPNVPGATSAVYEYWGEGFGGWYFAHFLIVYTVNFTYEVSFDANGGTGTMITAEVNEGEEYTLPECGFTAPSNKTFKAWSVGGEEKQPGDKITVSANTTVTAVWQNLVKYNLWVGGVQVTNANASNITGEGITGAVSYDSTTKTLTLNNATITGVHEFSIFDDVGGIYGKETLKINLIGNNTITGSDNGGSSYGIYIDDGNLTFTGTGSLTVSAADLSENNWSVAVFAEGTITVEESCTITAYCGANAWIACAFKSYAGSNEYNLPNATGILVAGNKNAPEATNFEVCNGDPDEFQYLRIAPGYTVTLNKAGGTIHSGNVTCYFVDTGATLPTEVTKANSIFGGWYDNAECTGTAITEIPVGSTGEKEYWAKWTAVHTCSIEPVEKVWPDCENGGKEAYYKCDGCGKFFEDANGTTEIVDIATWGIIDKLGHAKSGWKTDGTHHWKTCTRTTCAVVIEGTKGEHTSTGNNVATCTKLAKCDICGVSYGEYGSHDFTAAILKITALKTEGNCRDNAVYYYSCDRCGLVERDSKHTFLGDKVASNHVGGTTLVNASATDHKTQTDGYTGDTKCLGCGEITAYGQAIPAGAHTPASTWTTDGTHHWKVCSVAGCGVVIDNSKATHSSTGTNFATCQKKAVCDDCGATYGDFAGHDWNTASWEKDATGHWHKCNTAGCTEKSDFAQHTPDHQGGVTEEYAVKCAECLYEIEAQLNHTHVFDKEVAQEQYLVSKATCTDPAKYYKSCKCGEKGTETFESGAANGHTEGTEWKTDGENHWHICTVAGCGAVIENSKAAHTSTGDNVATCQKVAKCDICSASYGEVADHDPETTWTTDETGHWHKCKTAGCGEKLDYAEHHEGNADGKCDSCAHPVTVSGPPETGDQSHLQLWLGLLVISSFGIVAITLFGKKKYSVR